MFADNEHNIQIPLTQQMNDLLLWNGLRLKVEHEPAWCRVEVNCGNRSERIAWERTRQSRDSADTLPARGPEVTSVLQSMGKVYPKQDNDRTNKLNNIGSICWVLNYIMFLGHMLMMTNKINRYNKLLLKSSTVYSQVAYLTQHAQFPASVPCAYLW